MPEHKQYIAEHLNDDIRDLVLKLKSKPSGLDVPFVIRQIAGRQVIKAKLPLWYANEALLFPEHISLEQCSSEWTAGYKASLCGGESLVDLTGGFGVDCVAMSSRFKRTVYVERQEELCRLARHNFVELGAGHIVVEQGNAEQYLRKMPKVDCIYIDPARRDRQGKKTVLLSDCTPDVAELKDLLLEKASSVCIKLSPMLDISLALQSLPETREVHVVSVNNECKELLFLMKRENKEEDVRICTANLKEKHPEQRFSFYRKEEQECWADFARQVENYLYEPNVSLLKAGAYKILSRHFPIRKLHPDSHLYTSQSLVDEFPGRIFRVESVFPLQKKQCKEYLNGVKQANITVRNFPLSVDELRKKTGLKAGGETYLFATTLYGGEKVLVKCYRESVTSSGTFS